MPTKLGRTFIISLCTLFMVLAANGAAVAASPETLTIKGDGVGREVSFSRAELESMSEAITQNVYSVTNNFPTDKVMYRKGLSLEYVLKQAGILDSARQLKFISSDGYQRSFTRQELLGDARYYFNSDGSRVSVPTVIAFEDSGKGYDSMTAIELALTMGQRIKGEQNNPWFVKYLQTIEVSTAPPPQWPVVTFSSTRGVDGYSVQLKHSNFDLVKIYYTTDGTEPTIKSNLYNISASYYQPELNRPITVKENAEIRAIAIGAGKIDSEVSSSLTSTGLSKFSDLGGFSWASAAIDELNRKGIIEGMGGSLFAPGEPLTRAQFATMIITALQESPGSIFSKRFNDVGSSDWHWPYVEKAAQLGLICGYSDGTFRPDQVLSRQEMLTIAVQAMEVKVGSDSVPEEMMRPFVNENRISSWARPYIALAEAKGILEHGHIALESGPGLTFDAQGQANRAEAAVTVYRMLGNSK